MCETDRMRAKRKKHAHGGVATEKTRCQTPFVNSTMSVQLLFNTHQKNRPNSFCPLSHCIIGNPQGLCDNCLVAWLAWRKALLAEFFYRYAVWQHNVLREQSGCWIRVMQTDRVSWNMKPGRSNLSEKRENVCVCVWERVNKLGRGRRRRGSIKKVGDWDEVQNLAREERM